MTENLKPTPKPTSISTPASGFTLIETIMIIVLLAILGSGILIYFFSIAGSGGQVITVQAVELAEDKVEEVLSEKNTSFSGVVSEASAAFSAPMDDFTSEVDVFCVAEADLDASSGTIPDCTDSDINAKRITVTVSWSKGGGGSVSLVTVVSDH
ncbi:MAG: type II secretion system protein [Thermodesulfobacteriota bacterium]